MCIMSHSRGNNLRKRPQKHQNKTAFKNDLHDTSHLTKIINSLQVTGVCNRCKDIIEWKIKYKKYKPLAAPRKCVNCEQRTIKHAYHMLCSKCVSEKKACAKCCKPVENEESSQGVNNIGSTDIKTMLKGLPERKRRTILRFLTKQQGGEEKTTTEIKSQIEYMLSKMDNINIGDELCGFSSEDESLRDSDEDC